MSTSFVILFCAGVIAGLVDSIIGGGALITIPSLALFLGVGPFAVGSSKIAGTMGALVAAIVYFRKGHLDLRASIVFAIATITGSFLGSRCAAFMPPDIYRYILVITCPILLWLVWRKDIWFGREVASSRNVFLLVLAGLSCGFYDGIWGPGSGILMFLSLLFFARLPVMTALAAAKFTGFFSSGTALINYSLGGFVHLPFGATVALGFGTGAFLGANLATQRGIQIARPVLVFLSCLLMVRALN